MGILCELSLKLSFMFLFQELQKIQLNGEGDNLRKGREEVGERHTTVVMIFSTWEEDHCLVSTL